MNKFLFFTIDAVQHQSHYAITVAGRLAAHAVLFHSLCTRIVINCHATFAVFRPKFLLVALNVKTPTSFIKVSELSELKTNYRGYSRTKKLLDLIKYRHASYRQRTRFTTFNSRRGRSSRHRTFPTRLFIARTNISIACPSRRPRRQVKHANRSCRPIIPAKSPIHHKRTISKLYRILSKNHISTTKNQLSTFYLFIKTNLRL